MTIRQYSLRIACLVIAASESKNYRKEHDAHLREIGRLPLMQQPLDAGYWLSRRPIPYLGEEEVKLIFELDEWFQAERTSQTEGCGPDDDESVLSPEIRQLTDELYEKYYSKVA